MRAKNITTVVNRQIQNVNQAIPKIKEGIQAVSRSPGVAAAEQIDVMVQNFLASFQSGELEAALRGVNLEEWKTAALAGTTQIGPGMERKRATIEKFHEALQSYQLGYTKTIDAMSSGNLESSRARMNANFDAMSQFKFKK